MTDMREHLDIMVLKREADRLAAVDAGWTTWQPEDRVAFRAEWHDLMDVLGDLVDAYDRGRLHAGDMNDLSATAAVLLRGWSSMERMRLRLPSRENLERIVAARVA